ncbi:hypothetical protein Bca4012_095433 [Brassica carinata]
MTSTVYNSQGILHPRGFRSPEPGFGDSDGAELVSVSWNQDYSCFSSGTSHGFRIYNCEPFKETFRRELKDGGFKIVEMLFRSNILALVGGGPNSQYPSNKVLIWDDHQSRCISEFSFRSEIRAVKLRRDRIVVVLEHKIYVYNFMDLRLLHQIENLANPRGLCCLSHHMNTSVLACPGVRRGEVRVEHFGLNMVQIINAHDANIACMTMTLDGLLLATASTKGTLIRIFNTMDGTRLQEVRRGTDRADIYSIALSPNVQWLAVSSDKGTVHIFSLRVRVSGEDSHSTEHETSSNSLQALVTPASGVNPGSSLSFLRGVLPRYFSSEWSFAQFHVPEVTQFFAAFGAQNTIAIIGMDGRIDSSKLNWIKGIVFLIGIMYIPIHELLDEFPSYRIIKNINSFEFSSLTTCMPLSNVFALVVVSHLPLKDNIRASTVSKTWHEACLSVRIPDKPPWLIYLSKTEESSCELYDPSMQKRYYLSFPELSGSRVCHSNEGWLLMYNPNSFQLFFFSPFAHDRIPLPPLWMAYDQRMYFSCAPTSSTCLLFTVTNVTLDNITVKTCYPNAEEWNTFVFKNQLPVSTFEQIVFSNGVFYCLTNTGHLSIFDPSSSSWNVFLPGLPLRHHGSNGCFMAQHQGEIFLIYMYAHMNPTVLRLDHTSCEWTERKTLGGLTIYASGLCSETRAEQKQPRNCLCLPVFHGFKRTCIYYKVDKESVVSLKWKKSDPYANIWIMPPLNPILNQLL